MEHSETKTYILGEKPVLSPLCKPQIPHRLAWKRNPGLDQSRGTTRGKVKMVDETEE
jgi:hypothetical protein